MRICEEALKDWIPSRATVKPDLDLYPSMPFTVDISCKQIQQLLYMAAGVDGEDVGGDYLYNLLLNSLLNY